LEHKSLRKTNLFDLEIQPAGVIQSGYRVGELSFVQFLARPPTTTRPSRWFRGGSRTSSLSRPCFTGRSGLPQGIPTRSAWV